MKEALLTSSNICHDPNVCLYPYNCLYPNVCLYSDVCVDPEDRVQLECSDGEDSL